jgi:DNA-binding CsgD family transcriptional regulator
VERAAARLEDPVILAQARRLEGLGLYAAGEVARATAVLLDAAAMTGPDDRRLARDILLDALVTAHFTRSADTARVLGMVAKLRLPDDAIRTLTDLLLDGFAALGEGRHADGAALLRLAVGPLSGGGIATATAALDSLAPMAAAADTPAALGWLALGRAMLAADSAAGTDGNAAGSTAEAQYQLAIEHLERSRHIPVLARARLLYGEWLRRQRRRRDARDQLNTACEMFTRLGMDAFAERARVELRAVGEVAHSRAVASADGLTPQELQIARLASEGASNAEIAARLFISASTVEYHLRKVFRKLGITTRVRIGHALSGRYEIPAAEQD